jgi:hypothetical protein
MALQIDDDWKKQAQEEKRKLAEQAKAREEAAAAAAKPASGSSASQAGARATRELPPADFTSLVGALLTQAGYYLGEYTGNDGEPVVDLDGAKYQIDLLGVLESKVKNNVTPAEQGTLDAALYELRSRYVSIATQMIR